MSIGRLNSSISRWPHRWAVLLACATFPLLWVGGLVTTTDAGMAVPDWPSTYGYNLFLYPWRTWLAGPWDLFVEHGHRLLGAVVGMITIGLLIVLWRAEERRWLRGLGVAALALVIFQGVLGGMRVRLDERMLAMLHGTTGPLFFALAVAIAVLTSRRWRSLIDTGATGSNSDFATGAHRPSQCPPGVEHIGRLAFVTFVLVYLQIVLGAVVRHVPVAAEPQTFALAVRFHLFLAAVLSLHLVLLVWLVLRRLWHVSPFRGLAFSLAGLLIVQLALGAGTWIVKFSIPTWAANWISTGSVAIQNGGWLQTHVITAHVAVGSLLLATSLALALYVHRLLPAASIARCVDARQWEAAV
jgi:cytochrome c oxidase assembly protein subunit 15